MSTLTIAAVQYDIQWLDQQANFKHLERLISDYFKQTLLLIYCYYLKHFQLAFVLTEKTYKSLKMAVLL